MGDTQTALSDLEINVEVARRIFGDKRIHIEEYAVYVYQGHAKRFKWETHSIDYKVAYFAEMYEPCHSVIAQWIERNDAQDDFVDALIRVTGECRRWELLRATPRQWCEAFLEIAQPAKQTSGAAAHGKGDATS